MIQSEDGKITKIKPDDRIQQESILKRLLTPEDKGFRGLKIVSKEKQIIKCSFCLKINCLFVRFTGICVMVT